MEAKKAKLDVSPTITDLPNEMLLKIFSYLPQSDHYAVGHVSKHFQDLIDNTKWCKTIPVLEITEENVRQVKKAIEMKNNKFSFKLVKFCHVTSINDLEYIVKSIGQQIECLSMRKTAVFHLLKNNVKSLKSLEIYFNNDDLENSINNGSFNLCFFPLLEELSFIDLYRMNSTTNKLLEQLKSPKFTASLKHFKLHCMQDNEDYLIDSLLHHSNTLESLDLLYFDNDNKVHYLKKWKITFSRMKNLRKVCLSPEMMNVITRVHPKETLLEHIELGADNNYDYNKILTRSIEKWMNSLQYLELNDFLHLTDDAAMEFGKLHNLRVFKISSCKKITSVGLLAGIAKEQNVFIDELHLEDIPKLDESGLGLIISRLPNLRVLILNYLGKAITNTSLQSIWRFSTRLRSLSIDCRNITDEGIFGFGNEPYSINRLRLLVKLTLNNCDSLTDRTLIEGLKLPALRSLELSNCTKITLKGLEGLVKVCPLLEFLSIPKTLFLNDNAIFIIVNGFKHLSQLKITGCGQLSNIVRVYTMVVLALQRITTANAIFARDFKLEFE